MPNIDEVVSKYIELRDRKAAIAKRQQEELEPLNKAMSDIEAWLLNTLNGLGVDSVKTPSGTPYKAVSNSVRLTDAGAFKGHVFAPAVEGIHHYLMAKGIPLQPVDLEALQSCLQSQSRWDMVDFRAGKKGVLEAFESTSQLPPGVTVESSTVVNVRRS